MCQPKYTPYYYLSTILIQHSDEIQILQAAQVIMNFFKQHLEPQTIILGPTACTIAKIKDKYRYQIILKYRQPQPIYQALHYLNHYFKSKTNKSAVQISIDMNPYHLG